MYSPRAGRDPGPLARHGERVDHRRRDERVELAGALDEHGGRGRDDQARAVGVGVGERDAERARDRIRDARLVLEIPHLDAGRVGERDPVTRGGEREWHDPARDADVDAVLRRRDAVGERGGQRRAGGGEQAHASAGEPEPIADRLDLAGQRHPPQRAVARDADRPAAVAVGRRDRGGAGPATGRVGLRRDRAAAQDRHPLRREHERGIAELGDRDRADRRRRSHVGDRDRARHRRMTAGDEREREGEGGAGHASMSLTTSPSRR